ncbi:unnamed protein product [Caenorhabditis angaria]|uniref:Uncharacterized protein n=1 Tax=Caenorhabditis angaria TaxID=860376 RepID=A0A9P1N2B9_9PELO|nr:unnamed protein product [Caenorhabditis angaria]
MNNAQRKNEKLSKNVKSSRRKTNKTQAISQQSARRKKGSQKPTNRKTARAHSVPSTIRTAQNNSSLSDEKLNPKQVVHIKRDADVDENAVKTFIAKFNKTKPNANNPPTRRKLSNTDLLTLDMVNKKTTKLPSNNKKSTSPGGNKKPSQVQSTTSASTNNQKAIVNSHSTDEPSEEKDCVDGNFGAFFGAQSIAEEDRYDDVPRIEDVVKMPEENVFLVEGGQQTKWMEYIEPTEGDMTDVEPPFTVGGEQIEMYHDKKFKLHCPPETKLLLDQWEQRKYLAKRDDLFFTPPLVFSNTIRSLINVGSKETGKAITTKKKKNTESDDQMSPTQIEEEMENVKIVGVPVKKVFVYERSDPIASASRKIVKSEREFKSKMPLELMYKYI